MKNDFFLELANVFFPWKGACHHLFTSTTYLPLTLLPIKECTALKSSTETLGELKVEQIKDSDFDFEGMRGKTHRGFKPGCHRCIRKTKVVVFV